MPKIVEASLHIIYLIARAKIKKERTPARAPAFQKNEKHKKFSLHMIITPQGIEDHQQYEKTEVDIVEQNFKKTFLKLYYVQMFFTIQSYPLFRSLYYIYKKVDEMAM